MSEAEQRAARATRRDHCRGCGRPTAHTYAGWATPDGRENTIRPRAYYRACADCGIIVLVLADVTDAEGVARYVLDEHLRPLGGAATATTEPVGPPPVDWGAALGFLFETAWLLYSDKWDPAYGDGRISFRNYAVGTLRLRLDSWIRDETGEASDRSKGRVHPKAHAASVSVSYDELTERFGDERYGDETRFERQYAVGGRADDHGGLDPAGRGGAGDFADDRSPDLARALAARHR